jgi:hypothetical protein
VHVRRVAGQQYPADPVPLRQPRAVAEPGEPARRVHPEVRAGPDPQLLPDLVEGRRHRTVLGHPVGGHHDPVHPVPDRAEPEPQLALADFGHHGGHALRRRRHLHLAQQGVHPGGFAGEADTEQLAYRAAAAVAADEETRPQLRAVGQLGGHPVRVLAQPGHRAPAADGGAEPGGVLGQQAFGDGLRDAEGVRVRAVQPVRHRLTDGGEEAADRVLPAVSEEPLQQTSLVHHLDAARVQAERADHRRRLRLLLQYQHLDAVQAQLAGQHQAGRPGTGNDHVEHEFPHSAGPFTGRPACDVEPVRRHRTRPCGSWISAGCGPGRRLCSSRGALPQGPPCAIW